MIEHNEALGLEQRCIKPGHWRIEGHDVVRQQDGWWLVYEPGSYGSNWKARRLTKTLAAARDWIRSHPF